MSKSCGRGSIIAVALRVGGPPRRRSCPHRLRGGQSRHCPHDPRRRRPRWAPAAIRANCIAPETILAGPATGERIPGARDSWRMAESHPLRRLGTPEACRRWPPLSWPPTVPRRLTGLVLDVSGGAVMT